MINLKLSSNNNIDIEVISTKLYVKYMVCLRDKLILKSVLDKHGLNYKITVHGAIEFLEEITKVQFSEIKAGLSKSGLILLDEKESMVIDRIINTIIEVVHYSDTLPKLTFRDIFSEHAISNEDATLKIFSDVTGMSVMQFIVIQKIERAKELMLYEDMALPDIAELLNYKNQDLFIAQFKKITGLTPVFFLRLKQERMKISEKYISSSHSGDTGANF
jgi:AraC-like DNA-binding protein